MASFTLPTDWMQDLAHQVFHLVGLQLADELNVALLPVQAVVFLQKLLDAVLPHGGEAAVDGVVYHLEGDGFRGGQQGDVLGPAPRLFCGKGNLLLDAGVVLVKYLDALKK